MGSDDDLDDVLLARFAAGDPEAFVAFYRRHLADVLAVPGFVSARRFKVLAATTLGSGEPPQWQYVAIYEMECEDPQSAVAELMSRVQKVGEYLRYSSSLPQKLVEMTVLMTARRWTQQYEWNAHYPLALKAGLKKDVADAIAEGIAAAMPANSSQATTPHRMCVLDTRLTLCCSVRQPPL